MGHTINAILLASLIATDDPNADAWDSVDYHRAMSRDCGAGMVDLLGRAVVDALPDLAFALACDDDREDAFWADVARCAAREEVSS